MAEPLAVGLIGAGPWAHMVHAPMLAAGPETRLAGVWARRSEAAAVLATKYSVPVFATPAALFDACAAVAFCVPPDVQAVLALEAARRGKALLLEKPIALELAAAERLAEAVSAAGVPSLVVLAWRYAPRIREFIAEASALQPFAGRALFVSGAFLAGPFATPWRIERGPLLDLGPHLVDLLEAVLGPVTQVRAHGELRRWVGLQLDHAGGAVSEAAMCASVPIDPHRAIAEFYGSGGAATLDLGAAGGPATFANVRREFAEAVAAGGGHPLDVQRGLHLQRILAEAERQLR